FELRASWSKDDLKTAFRRLARKYHPDVNHGNREADSQFKFVNRAYEALSRQIEKPAPPAAASQPPQSAPPHKKSDEDEEADFGSVELYQKLKAVVEARRKRGAAKASPSLLSKMGKWFS